VILALAIVVLAGCSVGPDYAKPDLRHEYAEAWRTELVTGPTTSLTPSSPTAAWWRSFGDPELERLVGALGEGNLTLAEARERIVEARARRGIVNAERLPQVDLSAEYLRAGTGDKGLAFQGAPPGVDTDLYGVGAMAGWEVDLWGRVARLAEAADRDIEASVESYRDAAVSLVAELTLSYVDVRALGHRLELLDRNVELLEKSLALAKSRYQAGTGTELDVTQARRLLQHTQAREPELRRALAVATDEVAVLLGRPPADGLVGPGAMPQPPALVGMGLPADLITRRADVRRAERQYAATVARVGAAEGERYPRLKLFGQLSLQTGNAADLVDPEALVYSLGPSLTFPLFAGGRIESNVRVQKSKAEQARIALEKTLLDAVAEVENAAAGVVQTQKRVELLAGAADDARRSVDLAEQLYRAGTRDLLQVVDAQRELVEVEDELVVARRDALDEIVRLYRALGGGWPVLTGEEEKEKETVPAAGIAATDISAADVADHGGAPGR
jgi:multidrug efflux system outer membrane protein